MNTVTLDKYKVFGIPSNDARDLRGVYRFHCSYCNIEFHVLYARVRRNWDEGHCYDHSCGRVPTCLGQNAASIIETGTYIMRYGVTELR